MRALASIVEQLGRLRACAKVGLANVAWARFEITGDPGIYKPGLLDHSLMDLDLFRLHLLETALKQVAPTTLAGWSCM